MEKTKEQIAAELFLMMIRKKIKAVQATLQEIEALEYAASGMGAIRYDKEHVDGGSGQDRLILFISDALKKRVELEEQMAEVDNLKEKCYLIIKKISEPSERIFLEWYYINGAPMHEVINKLYVSERKAYYIKDSALQHFGELI